MWFLADRPLAEVGSTPRDAAAAVMSSLTHYTFLHCSLMAIFTTRIILRVRVLISIFSVSSLVKYRTIEATVVWCCALLFD